MKAFDEEMTKRRLEGFQGEDRIHRVGGFKDAADRDIDVIYLDAEAGDDKLRALLNAHGDKPTIIVIDANSFDMAKIEPLMARKKEIINMQPEVLLDEFSKKFK